MSPGTRKRSGSPTYDKYSPVKKSRSRSPEGQPEDKAQETKVILLPNNEEPKLEGLLSKGVSVINILSTSPC